MMRGKSGRILVVSVLLILLTLGFVVSVYADSGTKHVRIARVLDMLERGVNRAEQLAAEQGVLDEKGENIAKVRMLINEARSLLEQGELEQAWLKTREAMQTLRQIFTSLPNPPQQPVIRKLNATIHRLNKIIDRLENLAQSSPDPEIRDRAGEAVNKLRSIIQQAEDALENGNIAEVFKKLREAGETIREFTSWMMQYSREKVISRVRQMLDNIREELQQIKERLQSLDEGSPRIRVALRTVDRLLNRVDEVENALDNGDIRRALRMIVELRRVVNMLENLVDRML